MPKAKTVDSLRDKLNRMGPRGSAGLQQIKEIEGTLPGWRWIESEVVDGEDVVKYVHFWVKIAECIAPGDVRFRARKGATNVLDLAVGPDAVFDDRCKLMSDVDGGDAEWTVEPDAVRGGARSVHITLTRCKSTGYIPWPRPFRNQKEVGDLPLFRKPVFGDGLAPPAAVPADRKKKKKRVAAKTSVILAPSPAVAPADDAPIVEEVTRSAAPKVGDFYGVPVTSASGAWSIVTGAAAATTESHLHARPKRRPRGDAHVADDAAPTARGRIADGVCAAVEEARVAARAAGPQPAPGADDDAGADDDEDDDFVVEGLNKVLFPARIFDPYFSLGLTIHEETLHVLAVAREGQGATMGVKVGWRAVYVGATKAPLASLQQLINELTGARQTKGRLPVYFEGDALE